MIKVVTIVGTRPELIRLSRVISRLDATVDHVLVHTGQNYDYALNEVFFRDLGLRAPDHYLGVDTSSLGATLGDILMKTEKVLISEKPDAVLILGDTNSSISSIIAKRMHIPVYHMEAGNRCFDNNVPEETNRRMVDHIADFNLVYTEHARRNLIAEGLHPRNLLLTGSPMSEVLSSYRDQIDASDVLDREGLTAGGYFLVSAHREENVDSPARLNRLLDCLTAVHLEWNLPVHISTHPRTRKRLEALPAWSRVLDNTSSGLFFHEPFGFHDYNKLQFGAACVLSDSGTIAEESSILGFPAVTLRDSIERPEALDTGSIIMTGLDAHDVVAAVYVSMGQSGGGERPEAPADYQVSDTSVRVVNFILSTARRHRAWSGLRSD